MLISMSVIMLILLIPFTSNNSIATSGKWISSESQEMKSVEVRLNGQLKHYLVRKDTWRGTIQLSGFDGHSVFEPGIYVELELNQLDKDFYYGVVFTYNRFKNRMDVYGTLYFSKMFESCYFLVPDEYGGGLICAPADSIEQAQLLIDNSPVDFF